MFNNLVLLRIQRETVNIVVIITYFLCTRLMLCTQGAAGVDGRVFAIIYLYGEEL